MHTTTIEASDPNALVMLMRKVVVRDPFSRSHRRAVHELRAVHPGLDEAARRYRALGLRLAVRVGARDRYDVVVLHGDGFQVADPMRPCAVATIDKTAGTVTFHPEVDADVYRQACRRLHAVPERADASGNVAA